jgi:hypothetical protein
VVRPSIAERRLARSVSYAFCATCGVDFRGAYFESAPEFHGCTLHQDTLFPKEANFRDRSGAKAALAYRTLKHAIASVHARGEEGKFYALEQKSLLRDKDTPLSTRFCPLSTG